MQTATRDGLLFAIRDFYSISATEVADLPGSGVSIGSRCTIKCIHNAAQEMTGKCLKDLVVLVSTKTPLGMYKILEKPDVNVGNKKDKEAMLRVIKNIKEHVMEGFENGFQKLQSLQSPPARSDPARLSQPISPAKRSQVAPSDSNAVTAY